MPVIDLESKRFWVSFERLTGFVNTNLPYGEIKRYTGGSANESSRRRPWTRRSLSR